MRIKTTLREALTDKRLLGKALEGDSWHVWRTILLAIRGERLTKKELKTFQEVTGRAKAPTEPCREFVGIVGRRGGKSRAMSVLATYLSTLCEYDDVLVPGERGLLLCIAPDTKQAEVVHDFIAGDINESEVLRPMLASSISSKIRLTNGIEIVVRSASFRRLRGITCVAAIADESCFWMSDERSTNRDDEILAAIRPALGTTGGQLCIISTPYARTGETWRLFDRHYGPQGDPRVLVATGPTLLWHPTYDNAIVDRAYEEDAAKAGAEYGGQWRADISAFFSREAIMACVDDRVFERPYNSRFKYHAFVDPSGGSVDSMALCIAHKERDRVVVDLIREARAPFRPMSVVLEFSNAIRAYNLARVTGDRYSAQLIVDMFAQHGVKYDFSPLMTSGIFLELLPLVTQGNVGLLDHKRSLDQLIRLERRTSFGTGRDTVGHPDRTHDDVAVALAGAVLMANSKPKRMRQGAIGVDGRVYWKPDPDDPPINRIRIIHVDENGVELPPRGPLWA